MSEEKSLKSKLEQLAKDKGLEHVEGIAEVGVDFAFDVLDLIVEHTDTKVDDLVYASLKGLAESALDELVNKIDGKEG